jgi:hypothetical protein
MEPPDPCLRKEDGLLRYLAWNAVALLLLGLFYLYMGLIRPFFYAVAYVRSWYRWRHHRDLGYLTLDSLIGAYSDRSSSLVARAFIEAHGDFVHTYEFAIRPGYHPAHAVIVLRHGRDWVKVPTRNTNAR